MDRLYFAIIISTVLLTASACGESSAKKSEATPTPQPGVKVNRNAVPQTGSKNTSEVPPASLPRVNSNMRTVINSNPMAGSSSPQQANQGEMTSQSNKSIERDVSRRRERFDVDPSATPPPATFRTAPEDSEFAVQMEKGGNIVETRLFNKHPVLKQVEIRWTGPQTRSLKVTLKSGKIIERQSVPAVNLRTVPSAELLDLAGIKSGR